MPLTPTMRDADGPRIAHDRAGGFSYVDNEMLVLGEAALVRLVRLAGGDADGWEVDGDTRLSDHPWIQVMNERAARDELLDAGVLPPAHTWARVSRVPRPLSYIRALRAEGHVAQPNHVFSAHGCGDPCGPHPAWMTVLLSNPLSGNPLSGNPLSGNPLSGNPLSGNPLSGNPLSGNPLSGNPLSGNPLSGNPSSANTAIPVHGRALPTRQLKGPGQAPVVLVLDSGLAGDRPPLLADTARFTGDRDEPDVDLQDGTGAVRDADGYLDPVAGHGTFIAGVIEQLAPGCTIHVHRVLTPFGMAAEDEVADAISAAVAGTLAGCGSVPDIINLSLGGPVMEHPFKLAAAVSAAVAKGIVVVASAGNSGTCTPQYPAALDGVVAVGALGPDGPAPWTNYGGWVDACAPGTHLVSAFFSHFDGNFAMRNTVDEDAFDAWACWSGTSFAAPVVVAALAREMVTGTSGAMSTTGAAATVTAETAVERLVRAPHLMRLPCLGTVVNI